MYIDNIILGSAMQSVYDINTKSICRVIFVFTVAHFIEGISQYVGIYYCVLQ